VKIRGSAIIVTGGASGLGEATVRALAARGGAVLVFDKNTDRGEALAGELDVAFTPGDVANTDDVERAVERAASVGPLRGLVNCAGIPRGIRTIGRDGMFASAHSMEQFERTLRVNLAGTFNVIRLAATVMSTSAPNEDGERGAIVNTASIAAFDGQIGQAAYAASKGGIVSMTLPIARDLASVGIRVNTIAPGAFETPIMGPPDVAAKFNEQLGRHLLFPRRFGQPPEFARLVVELLENGYINGEVIRLDAGVRFPPR
jgi:NAD(P)-dependent dehydrogenase (short-subunit alcohol dehydrogenase family)